MNSFLHQSAGSLVINPRTGMRVRDPKTGGVWTIDVPRLAMPGALALLRSDDGQERREAITQLTLWTLAEEFDPYEPGDVNAFGPGTNQAA